MEVLKNYMSEDKRNVRSGRGAASSSNRPEYSDVGKAKEMFALLESKEKLLGAASGDSDIGLSVNIAPCKDEKRQSRMRDSDELTSLKTVSISARRVL